MKNSEIVKNILLTLEKEHIDLYHDISKKEILQHINNIKNIDKLTDIEFDCEMLKLFAKFKDSHTGYEIHFNPISVRLYYILDKIYVKIGNKLREVVKINNIDIKTIINEFDKLFSYETIEWRNHRFNKSLNNGYYYQMLGLGDGFSCSYLVGKTLKTQEVYQLSQKEIEKNKTEPFYSYKILDNNILYFKYPSCKDDPKNPFEKLVKEVEKEIKTNNITDYILDIRGNTGGDSEILNPFQDLVKNLKLNGVLLIDNDVWSSGVLAVVRFKHSFNTLLIGEGTGGAAKHYGWPKYNVIDGKGFMYSRQLFDFGWVFNSNGSIQPDIEVKLTKKDIEANSDPQLEKAIEVLTKEKRLIK